MNVYEKNHLLLLFSYPLPPAPAVRKILEDRRETIRLASGPSLSDRFLRDCGLEDARIVPLERGVNSLRVRLQEIRRSRPGTALAIGGPGDLSGPLAAVLSGARRKQAVLVGPTGTRTVRIRPAVLAARLGGRLLLFLYALPATLLLRLALSGGRPRTPEDPPSLPPPAAGRRPPPVSLVVPNFNGRELLSCCLPSLERALAAYPGGGEIIVVDDGSTDGSAGWARLNHPAARVISLPGNRGFGQASNLGVAAARHRFTVLLNSDIVAEPDFLAPLLRHLADPEVFAVQSRLETRNGDSLDLGVNVGHMAKGYIRIWNEKDDPSRLRPEAPSPNLYAVGGAMAFDREKWKALGGFDDIFHPFFWEDIDISYRAGKLGWQVLYEPQSRLRHRRHATISRFFAPEYRRTVEYQNELLFTWKNIHSPRLWKEHLDNLPRALLSTAIRGDLAFYRGFWKALGKLGAAAAGRSREMARSRVSDEKLFLRSLLPYRNRPERGSRPRADGDENHGTEI